MNTFLNIIHLAIAIFGVLFLIYLLFNLWQNHKWRFIPKAYKKHVAASNTRMRIAAIKSRKRGIKLPKNAPVEVIIWDKSERNAKKYYNEIYTKHPKPQPNTITRIVNFFRKLFKLEPICSNSPIEIFEIPNLIKR